MGYYTDFEISIVETDRDIDHEELLHKIYNISSYQFSDDFWLQSAKWYRHHEDMITLSKEYPTTVFQLSGDGEERGDNWRKYYKNGKSHRGEIIITYEKYDANKLV